MDASDLERIWEAHAESDPLWAILSDPTKKDRRWDIDRFFESGEREIRFLLRDLETSGVHVDRRRALDFGCGIGRLTRALTRHFDEVVGIDISPTMIEIASALNDVPGRVRFVRNRSDALPGLDSNSFDFVYTNIVLQHIPPEMTRRYLAELLRVIRPAGALVFQLPSHPRPDAGEVRAMADDAYRAEITVSTWPRVVAPSSRVGLAARVVNTSARVWHPTALGQINLANHWITDDGTMERQDDGRAGLPRVVGPGQQAEIAIAVTAPEREGTYRCELDLVHETITWFKDRGSARCELPIEVRRSLVTEPPSLQPRETSPSSTSRARAWAEIERRLPKRTGEPEAFPMFGIPRDEVIDWLERTGGEVLAVTEDGHAGWEWVGYRYTVRKS